MTTTTKRKQWEREELADGHVLVWAQHGRYHIVYTVSPCISEAPENHYHGTSSFAAERAFEQVFADDMVNN